VAVLGARRLLRRGGGGGGARLGEAAQLEIL